MGLDPTRARRGQHRRASDAPPVPARHDLSGRRGLAPAAIAAAALAVAGTGLVVAGLGLPGASAGSPQEPPLTVRPAAAAEAVPAPAEPDADTGAGSTSDRERRAERAGRRAAPVRGLVGPTMPRSRPVALEIPAIDVRSEKLVELGQLDDGSLEVPVDYALPGWYEPGSAPGQLGPAVIAGHVDSTRGPAVFYRLGELERGDDVRVRREDGTTARFVIDRVERYRKDEFPTVQVYGGASRRAELRLITCGGEFDERTGHYLDNVVAYAHLV